jgi:hypothetical protein
MTDSKARRQQIENEVVFRQYNERVQEQYEEIKAVAKQDKQEEFIPDDTPLLFYCECSDENCRKRILLKPTVYTKLHKQRNRFVLITGHETSAIERVVKKDADYSVVEKFITPPKTASGLNQTDVDNT